MRSIHLSDIHDDSAVKPSLLGYSTGRWQDDTLVVTTTRIDYQYLHVENRSPNSSTISKCGAIMR